MAINVDISKITGINQVGNSYQRKSAVPLDYYSLFNTKAEAEAYAASNPVSYVGQVISYIDNGEVKVCVIANADGLLREVGTKPVGDGKTIEVSAEGAVALLGAASAANGTLPMLQEVDGKSQLVWKTLEDIGAGDGNDNTTYAFAFADQKITITPSFNGVAQTPIVLDLSVFATEDEMAAAIEEAIDALPEDKDTTYSVKTGEKALKLEGTEFSTVLDLVYDNNRISLLGIGGAEIAGFDASAFVEDGVLQDVEYNAETRELVFTWNVVTKWEGETPVYKTDVVSIADLVDVYAAGHGLNLDGSAFSIKLAEGCENFLSVGADGLKLSGVQTAIDTAKQEAIADADGKLAKKANSEDVYTKSEVYTKNEVYTKSEVYTKGEADQAIADKISEVNGGESAGEVLGQLNAYKKTVNMEVWGNEEGSGDSRIDDALIRVQALENVGAQANVIESVVVDNGTGENVPAAKLTATKNGKTVTLDDSALQAAIKDAKSVGSAAGTAASEAMQKATENANAISGHNTKIAGLETLTGTHTQEIAALQLADTTHAAEFATLNGSVTEHGTKIAALEGGKADKSALETLSQQVAGHGESLQTILDTDLPYIVLELPKKVNKTDLEEGYYTKAEVDAGVSALEKAIEDSAYNDAEVRGLISTNAEAIKALTEGAVADNAAAIAALKGSENEAGSIAALIKAEADRAKGVEAGHESRIAEIETFFAAIEAPDATIDTLAEIIHYIESDKSGAAEMAASIKANADAIAVINNAESGILVQAKSYTDAEIAKLTNESTGILALAKAHSDANLATAKKYTDDAIAAMFSVDDKTIKLNEDNKAYVAEVSTDLLVNGSMELHLIAGSASI